MESEIKSEIINGKEFFICKHNFRIALRAKDNCHSCEIERKEQEKQSEIQLEKNLDEKGKESKGFYYVEDYEEICKKCIETLKTHNERKIQYCPSCFSFTKLKR